MHSDFAGFHAAQLKRRDAAIASLQAFLRFETVCDASAPLSVAPEAEATFTAAREHLENTYNALLTASDVSVDHINTHSMLIEWKGSQPKLPALLLYGHYDVVPVGNKTEAIWTHPPWGGGIYDGYAKAYALSNGRRTPQAMCMFLTLSPPVSAC